MVKIIRGNFIKQRADALINPINADIIFDKGIPFLVKKNGGESIEKESFKYYPAKLGDVFVTHAGGLSARHIIHLVNRQFARRTSYNTLVAALVKALSFALQLKLKSVAIPPIYNRFSPEITANIICDGIKEAMAQNKEVAQLEIAVVIYDKDASELFYQTFQNQIEGVVLES